MAVPRRRPLLRPVLDPDDPVPGPLEAGRASSRPRSRPTADATSADQPIQVRVRFPNPGLAPPGGEVAVQVERKGQQPAQAHPEPASGDAERLRGGPAAGRRGRLRGPPAPPAGPRRPDPDGDFRVEAPAGELERVQMNEPELIRAAEPTGGQVLHAAHGRHPAEGPAQAVEGAARHRPADPALEHLAGPGAVPGLITPEWVFRKRKQMV